MGRTIERKTPTRLQLWTGAVVVLAAAALITGTIAIADTQHGVNRVGRETAPLAQSASDLYFALSDLDSQTARQILTIGDSDLDTVQGDAQATVNSRVAEIDADLRQAIGGTSDPAVQGQFQTMLDKVTLYHDLSTTALSLDQLSKDATKGHPDSVALAYYSRATDVMHFNLLPTAAQIRDSYAHQLTDSAKSENDSWSVDTLLVVVTTVLLLAALILFQVALSRRFHRTLNPFLALATAATAAFLVSGLSMTAQQSDRLKQAVDQHMDPYLGIQHARAVSYRRGRRHRPLCRRAELRLRPRLRRRRRLAERHRRRPGPAQQPVSTAPAKRSPSAPAPIGHLSNATRVKSRARSTAATWTPRSPRRPASPAASWVRTSTPSTPTSARPRTRSWRPSRPPWRRAVGCVGLGRGAGGAVRRGDGADAGGSLAAARRIPLTDCRTCDRRRY